jgi:hypothetical protein
VSFGKVANRWQLGALPQMPVVDLSLDARDNLVAKGLAAILADGEGQHPISLPLKWPGRRTSTVRLTDSKTVHCCHD